MRARVEKEVIYPKPQLARLTGRVAPFLRRFAREEDGALVIFGIYAFLLILMVGGIGIDLMRFERDRTKLQYTLDRAVLAAADLDQTLDAQSVVEDYFSKAGLIQYLDGVSVSEGLGFRNVSAEANADVQTQFMHMTGVDTLRAPAASAAEESIGNVEISMVLDVSGSMNSNSRLYNLKNAAEDFVDEMIDNTEEGKLSISIVPYATQVSLPNSFAQHLNLTGEQNYSRCVNFESNDFYNSGVNTVDLLTQTMHFDPWTYDPHDDHNGLASGTLVGRPICEDDSRRETLVLENSRTVLKDFIDDLWADGNTSIDLGMKWGVALLDEDIQPAIRSMVEDGTVNNDFADRPTAFTDHETLKVVVLMTDGQNTSQYYINEDYRTDDSPIFYNADENFYSVYVQQYDEYYWPSTGDWEDHAYGNQEAVTYCKKYRKNGTCKKWTTVPPEPGEAFAIEYPELWAHVAMERHVEQFYEPWMYDDYAWDDWYYDVREYVNSSTKNTQTSRVCDAAKDEGIIVFTIGFEAPSSGKAVLEDCASSDSHFFDVDGLEISEAFSSIASSIRKLRLTQ
ncbi:MAG: pilus assembly protein TadG-related protein [Paracoccaceae bacterium]